MTSWVVEMRAVTDELHDIRHSMLYAIARGSRCALGGLTSREQDVLDHADRLERRRAELSALIQEHQP